MIGQLLDSNALRVLWISIYRVHVLKDLETNLGAVDNFTCCKLVQIINRPRVHQDQVERDDVSVRYLLVRLQGSVRSGTRSSAGWSSLVGAVIDRIGRS